jgi:phage baseplate assembly protein gpV/phage protein D
MSAVVCLPRIEVTVDGATLAAEDARALGAVRVQQTLSLPTQCELTFYAPEGALAGAASMAPGAALRITVEGFEEPLFVGQVTAVDFVYGPDAQQQVRVRGYDLLHRLRKRQPVATHVQLSLAELARTLVADLGVRVQAASDSPVQQQLVQYRQSDLDMITELAVRSGLYFTLRDDVLHILTLEGIGNPVALSLGSSLLEACIGVNSDQACRSVETRGWDPWRAEPHRGRADAPRVGREVGASIDLDRVGESGQRDIVDVAVQGDSQAEGMAQAELDRRVASEVTLWGMANGNPGLQPGTPVEISGVAAPLEGRYILTAVTHVLDREQGFLSEIDTAPPRVTNAPAQGSSMTLGRVTRVDDPEALGRVRVMLPNYDEIETGWLGVVLPGAGSGKGLIALPDVDDRVLVLFVNGEPAQGLVLGGLYGTRVPPDSGVEAGAVRRFTLLTAGGQRLLLDDVQETLRVECSDGSFLQLSPQEACMGDSQGSLVELTQDRCRIHAATRLEIEAPGQPVVIRGQSIDFERA